MAVIIADNNNLTYNGNLSTVDGFYRVEAYNLAGAIAARTANSTAFTRYYPVTFANAGNCQGFVGFFTFLQIAIFNPTFRCNLEEILGTCTISNASPAVVTKVAHGLLTNDQVVFSTTSSLPSPIEGSHYNNQTTALQATIYYVKVIDSNTFTISLTAGGADINTTSAGGGTQYLNKVIATKSVPLKTLSGGTSDSQNYGSASNYGYPFVFDTPPPVTVDASKYIFTISSTVGAQVQPSNFGYTTFRASSGDNFCYATWCDNKISFTNSDTVLCKDKIIIDQDCEFGSVTGTGYTVNVNSLCLAALTGDDTADTTRIEWENAPSASHTMTINGGIFMGIRTSFDVGSLASPIPTAQKAKIVVKFLADFGSNTNNGIGYHLPNASKMAYSFHGEVPTFRKTTLTNEAVIGDTYLTVDDVVDWTAGDKIYIGKSSGTRESKEYEVLSVAGNQINLTSPITISIRAAGGTVAVTNRYGIEIISDTDLSRRNSAIGTPSKFAMSGVLLKDVRLAGVANGIDLPDFCSEWTIDKCFLINTSNNNTVNLLALFLAPKGLTVTDSILQTSPSLSGAQGKSFDLKWTGSFSFEKSGPIAFDNCNFLHYGQGSNPAEQTKYIVTNCTFEGVYILYVGGINPIFKNNKIFGQGYGFGTPIFKNYYDTGEGENSGNYLDGTYTGVGVDVIYGLKLVNWVFGTERANTTDVTLAATAVRHWSDVVIVNPNKELNFHSSNVYSLLYGSKIKVQNNGATNYHTTITDVGLIQSTGDGLTDTTVRTSGVGKFAMRFEKMGSYDEGNRLQWRQNVPTGDIQNKTMTVSVWCKINSADYYSATYQPPRLSVKYDNATTVYKEASNSTDWQLLSVSFAPTTTYGEITVTISTLTDQLTSSSYVYFDDMSVFYPPGVQLDLGGLDLWADGLPIAPAIATNITATDVWNTQTVALVGSGTVGKLITDNVDAPISGATAPTVSQVADAVWDEATSGHTTAGSFGEAIGKVKSWVGWLRSLL